MSIGLIRATSVAFASMFDNLQINRPAPDGTIQTINVPLMYAGKQAFVQRLFAQEDLDAANVYQSLPRMTFEISEIVSDPERKMQRMGAIQSADGTQKYFNNVPYNIGIELNIVAKNVSDCLQILEIVLPKFSPERVLSVNSGGVIQQIPFTLKATTFQNDFEGTLDKRQLITATLSFDAGIQLYGAAGVSNVIEEVIVPINDPNNIGYLGFGSPIPTTTYTASGTSPSGSIFEQWT